MDLGSPLAPDAAAIGEPGRGPTAAPLPVTIGVVGLGTMGAGIAQLALEHGHEVVAYDVDEAAIGRGRERIADGLARRVAKRGLEDDAAAEAVASTLERLRHAHAVEDVAAQADLVVEAALEDLALKRALFRALDAGAALAAPLATNTSALSVEAIARATERPERVLGLHFFNPAPVMPLVEVIRGPRTAPPIAALAARLVETWGKTPIQVRDAPGFVVNRVNRPFSLEPLRMLAAGEAGIERIDRAIEAAGFPMGPFAYVDLVGVDVNLAVAEALYEAFGRAPRFEPSPIQRELAADRRLGRKTGEGFYRYGPAGERLAPSARFAAGSDRSRLSDAEIVERVTRAIAAEARRTVDEGVATAPDIDIAVRLGARHPRGPFEWPATAVSSRSR